MRGRGAVGPALIVAVSAISFAAIFFRSAAPTHPLVIAATRLGLAALLLAWPLGRAWTRGHLSRRQVLAGLGAGAFYGAHFGTWVTSLEITSVASSVTLVTATPLMLAAWAIAAKRDSPTARHWTAIGLGLLGLTVIGWADLSWSAQALVGDGLALAGAAAMAGYLLLVRAQGPRLDVLAFGGLACASGAVVLGLATVVFGVPFSLASPESFGWIALSALLPQLVGHTLLTWALRHTTPTTVGIATIGEPVGATLLAAVWLSEWPPPLVIGGCAITLVAVASSLPRITAPQTAPRG